MLRRVMCWSAALAAVLSFAAAASEPAESGWIVLSDGLGAWQEPSPDWLIAGGARLDPERVEIFYGPYQVVKNGQAVDVEAEQAAHELMLSGSFDLTIRLHRGDFSDYYLTCDLTADYVRINAKYRS